MSHTERARIIVVYGEKSWPLMLFLVVLRKRWKLKKNGLIWLLGSVIEL
jgi:hypothetical protein